MMYAIIASVAWVTYIYLGILILVLGEKSASQKSFAVLCAMLAFWSFGCVGQQIFYDTGWVLLFDRIYFAGSELFILAGIIFILILTGNSKRLLYRLILLAIILRMAVYQTANWGWNLLSRDFPNDFWFVSHQVLSALETLFIPFVALEWGRKTSLHREKIQARIIIFSTIGGTIIGVVVDFLSGTRGYNPISCMIPLLWMVAVCFAIIRYGLMRFDSVQVNRELIKHMDRAVFMIDATGNITDLNDAALFLLESNETIKAPIPMDHVFSDAQAIEKRAKAVLDSKSTNFTLNGVLRTFGGHSISVVTSFSIISDVWGDRIGILCICLPKMDLHAFINRYNLSERQIDILHYIISGRSQTQTADALFISLATVKTHTTSLYNRLGISSRSELYALLRGESLT